MKEFVEPANANNTESENAFILQSLCVIEKLATSKEGNYVCGLLCKRDNDDLFKV